MTQARWERHARHLEERAGTTERNNELRRRVAAGEKMAHVARELGMKKQRAHQILNRPARGGEDACT
jgi:hypothetical protein